jgi:integrase
MSPKPRTKENKSLPSRWRIKHGAYYYRVPVGLEHQWEGKTEFRLGTSQAEAYREWASRIELHANARTIGQLLERYAVEYVPTKRPKTQESYLAAIKKLTPVFGNMLITSLRTVHVFQYRDKRGKQAPTATNHEVGVLSHAYTKAIEWGLAEENPIKGKVGKIPTPPRTRYIEDWELVEALKVATPFVKAYIHLKLLTGLRRGDMLSILHADLKPDGIHVQPTKTQGTSGKKVVYEWNDELTLAVEIIKTLSRNVESKWLFCTRSGKGYMSENGRSNSFDSLWQRFIAKAMEETDLKERFTEHDLRAKVASDNDSERARQLLGHTSAAMTDRVYRRKPELIKPSVRGGK